MRRRLVALVGAALTGAGLLLTTPLAGQQENISRAFELERRGEYAAAADAYRAILGTRPADAAALLGLERVLVPLNRTGELLREVRAALASKPVSAPIYGVAIRAWTAADEPDSVRAVVERWALLAPSDESPYREWGAAALGRGDRARAVEAYAIGRERLKRPDALAAERAQLAVMDGEWVQAASEWSAAVHRTPGFRLTATGALSQAPVDVRPEIVRVLSREDDFAAHRLEAELRVQWGDPAGGLQALIGSLPDDRGPAVEALRSLIEQIRTQRTPEGRLALARGLEALADRSPEADRSRLRLESARVYATAGDRDAARRMLAGLVDDRSASAPVAAGASSTLVQVLITEGRLEEASRRFETAAPSLSSEERDGLRLRLAAGWLRQGDAGKAETALGADSTVEALALLGRIRLVQGDIAGAMERLRQAGPYAGDRQEATNRTALVALLQPIDADSFPMLGRAMLHLEQGDTAHAIGALEEAARSVPAGKGGAGIAFLAGRLAAATGNRSDAERLFRAAAAKDAPGTAPAAELALAELFLDEQRPSDALVLLEHLILTYPESALVPQARRRLDQARGAVPKT